MTVFDAGSGLRQHPRSNRRTNSELVSHLQWAWVDSWAGRRLKLGQAPMAETQAGSKRARGRSKSKFLAAHLSVLRCCFSSQRMPGSSCSAALSRRSSRRPLLRYGSAIPLRSEAALELDVVGREPQRPYRRQTSSMQRQAQVTGVRGVCVR
jgi:hypothetical protein